MHIYVCIMQCMDTLVPGPTQMINTIHTDEKNNTRIDAKCDGWMDALAQGEHVKKVTYVCM